MKKIKLGAMLLALSMVLVSCGGSPEEKVATYVEKSLTSDSMEQAKEKADDAGIELKVVAEGTSVAYQYKYLTSIEELGGEDFTAGLEGFLNDPTMLETQKNTLVLIQEECPEVTSLKYEYYDNQGNLLTSAEVN